MTTQPEPALPGDGLDAAFAEARWLIAGTSVGEPFPCRCRRDGCCDVLWCKCVGRLDLDQVPASCCARRNTPAVWKQAYDRSEAVKAAGRAAARDRDGRGHLSVVRNPPHEAPDQP